MNKLALALPKSPIEWLDAIERGAERWDINTPDRMAAFVGQLAHESLQFFHLEENLNYSAKRLMQVWPKRFPTEASTKGYTFNPEALANKVYANRMGNGPEKSGDGYFYRGRGPIQLTGFENHKLAGEAIGVDLVSRPEKLLVPAIGVAVAGWYWYIRGLNALADKHDHEAITQAINGGTHGLEDRIEWFHKIRAVL